MNEPLPNRGNLHFPAGLPLAALLVLCLFLSYPIALVVPVRAGVPLAGLFALPTFFWFSLAACGWLLLELARRLVNPSTGLPLFRDPPRLMLLFFAVFAAAVAVNAALSRSPGASPTVEMVGMAAVPLFFALRPSALIPRLLPPLLAVLWLVLALHGFWQRAVGFEVVGLTGNRNWMAVLILALAPWVWLALAGDGESKPHAVGVLRKRILPAAAAATALFLAWEGSSRAAWLMLGLYLLFFRLVPRFSWKGRSVLALGAAAAVLAAAFVLLTPERLERIRAAEIRPELWKSTLRLVADHPLMGIGAGNFQREFVHYKSDVQKRVLVAAPVTEHPHCEPLRLAAEAGVPLALLWLVLWLPLWRGPAPGGFGAAVHFGAWMICGSALFDKTLVQTPSGLLGLMFLGLLWNGWLATRPRGGQPAAPPASSRLAWAVAVPLAAFGVWQGFSLSATSWWMRRGVLAEEVRHEPAAAFEAYRLAAKWDPENVAALVSAGIVARRDLRRPDAALEQFDLARRLDPDFAHLNGEIGTALAVMGGAEAALPFLHRDAELFPYDPPVWRRLLICLLGSGRDAEALAAAANLPAADHHRAVRYLGAETVHRLGGVFLKAVREGDEKAALAAASELASPAFHTWLADPAFPRLCLDSGFPLAFASQPFGSGDFLYWRRCFLGKPKAPVACPDGSLVLRASPFDFCARHQILANILHAEFGAEAVPPFGEMPSLRLARCRLKAGVGKGGCFRLELDWRPASLNGSTDAGAGVH